MSGTVAFDRSFYQGMIKIMRNVFAILIAAIVLPLATPGAAHAQTKWKEIGKTASNNVVYIDPASVKKADGITTARVRVKFVQPVQAQKGQVWRSSQHIMMFDCAKSTVAAKETIYFSDERGTHQVEKSVVGKPGFGSPIGGSMTKVAMDYVCGGTRG
jgi:hypothetical protein